MNTEKITVAYTIFNKDYLIPKIVEGIKKCFTPEDEIIFLFDSCTDNSYEVCKDEIVKQIPSYQVKMWQPVGELFEIKANNYILEHAENDMILLFQDDMICKDKKIKEKLEFLVRYYGDELGLVGCRDGFELKATPFPEQPLERISSWTHKDLEGSNLFKDTFFERTFLNRGPVMFTKKLLKEVGYLDEAYYPQWGDDMDYCAKAKFKFGKKNIVLQADIESRIEWGATRKGSKLKHKYPQIMRKNWDLFISRWGEYLK